VASFDDVLDETDAYAEAVLGRLDAEPYDTSRSEPDEEASCPVEAPWSGRLALRSPRGRPGGPAPLVLPARSPCLPAASAMLWHRSIKGSDMIFLGLRTVIYPAPELQVSKTWFSALLGVGPYFDEPFYVGFNVAGYELGLDPNADQTAGPTTYWGVADADHALTQLLKAGALPLGDGVRDVGDGIRVATVQEPGGSVLGVIENPHFELAPNAGSAEGPGR